MYKNKIKPLFDFLTSLFLLLILSPFLILIIFILFIKNNGEVFFFQQRPGLNNKPFYIIKFKTMRDIYDENGEPLPDKDRLTDFGRFIRSASLDELLQLINVIKGDMSLVGPRPLLMKYLSRYNDEQAKRHEVKPGITGWAQVNGRNAITWDQKFKFDIEYLEKQSFCFDLKILLKTLNIFKKRDDVNSSKYETMEEFY